MSPANAINNLWWTTPLQVFTIVGTAANFGGSALQTPLVMPMLQLSSVPTVHAAQQCKYLLSNSEFFFPPLNAACTLTNLILTITAYLNKDKSLAAAQKLPFFAAATGLSLATTAYALTFMVPLNNKIKGYAAKLEVDPNDKNATSLFRNGQTTWQTWNLGRAAVMISGAAVSAYALLLDGSV